jgi:selenoprotein W-related protein
LAAELKQAFPGVVIKMLPSGGGVFEVTADGSVVFSKKKIGRHAEPGEVVRLLQARP